MLYYPDETPANAELQDRLTGALIGLSKAIEGNEYALTDATASCGKSEDYPMENLRNASGDSHVLRTQLLSRIREIASCICRTDPLAESAGSAGSRSPVSHFLYQALYAIGMDDWGSEELLPLVQES